jgi:hypothetical protein
MVRVRDGEIAVRRRIRKGFEDFWISHVMKSSEHRVAGSE